jgi:hypothetical protein
MNCAYHPERAVAAYCRTCGKGLCEECKRDVRGVIYCEKCIADRLQGAVADPHATMIPPPPMPPNTPNPAIAALLSVMPGVGAMYNGQYAKGLGHGFIFFTLIWAANQVSEFFGLLIAIFWFYQLIDAYRTAKAMQYGLPVPDDPFGFARALPRQPSGRPEEKSERFPTGAIFLIVIGVVFLMINAGLFSWRVIGDFWPVILIALGIKIFYQRTRGTQGPEN